MKIRVALGGQGLKDLTQQHLPLTKTKERKCLQVKGDNMTLFTLSKYMSIFWQNFFEVPFLKIEGFIGLLSLGFEGQWGFFAISWNDETYKPSSRPKRQ